MGKAKGVLKNFLIEPFVPHTQVMYATFLCFVSLHPVFESQVKQICVTFNHNNSFHRAEITKETNCQSTQQDSQHTTVILSVSYLGQRACD